MEDLSQAKLMPARKDSGYAADVSRLEGKKIIKAGYITGSERGGLAFDYQDGKKIKRLVLGFNDLGIWVNWHGEKGKVNSEDVLKKKICNVWDDLATHKITIVDKPLEHCYSFINENKEELLSLSIVDLKTMNKNVRKNFTSNIDKNIDENFNKILGDLGTWTYN